MRLHVSLKLLDSQLNPIVSGNLFRLARLNSLEVGENYVRQQANERGIEIVHEQILRTIPQNRMITEERNW